MLVLDYECLNALVSHRVMCNEGVANHATIQVQQYKGDEYTKVGLLGILNGIFGIREDGMGAICMEVEADGMIIGFSETPVNEGGE